MTARSALLACPAVPAPAPDTGLATRLAAGHPQALAELSANYRERIRRFVRAYGGLSPELSEDITQQVFVEVARTAGRFEGRSKLTTWLFGVARNLCRMHLRRREDAMEPEARIWRTLPDPGRDPEQLFESTETTAAVRTALASLPAVYRAVLVLRQWEELSYDQIATVTGVPVGTVRSRLHTARALMAEQLLALLGDDHDEL